MPNPWYKRLVDILPLQFEMRANISMGLYVHSFQLISTQKPDEPNLSWVPKGDGIPHEVVGLTITDKFTLVRDLATIFGANAKRCGRQNGYHTNSPIADGIRREKVAEGDAGKASSDLGNHRRTAWGLNLRITSSLNTYFLKRQVGYCRHFWRIVIFRTP